MYQSSLAEKEWEKIKDLFKRPDPRGNRGIHDKKAIVDAILYVVKGGIPWRMLPHDFPPWKTVYDHFRNWNRRGIWEKAVDLLNRDIRKKLGRKPAPTYAIVDAQSTKTIYNSQDRGFDAGKKNKRKKKTYRS